MIKTVILDDEFNCVEALKWKLENFCPDIEIVATFQNPEKAIAYLEENQIDLLFLDIQMPLLNGFDVLEALENITFDVIFTTAYDNYGILAVKFSALDYLLKPIRQKELVEAIEKYKAKSSFRDTPTQVSTLLNNIEEEQRLGKPERITLATKESLELVDPVEIIFCSSDSNYTMVYLKGGRKKLISRTLREFEEMLVPYSFYRPHNSFLVNSRRQESGRLPLIKTISWL